VLDLTSVISEDGVVPEALELASADGAATIEIPGSTTALGADGTPLEAIEIRPAAEGPAPPVGGHVIGLVYDLLPQGATFEPPIRIALGYDPTSLPTGVPGEGLVIAYYDAELGWQRLLSAVVSPTVTADVSHFTYFAVLAEPAGPQPAAIVFSNLDANPAEAGVGEPVTISVDAANIGQVEGRYRATLKIDGVVEAIQDVNLAGGANTTLLFTVAEDLAGTYVAEVDGQSGEFAVLPSASATSNSSVIGVSIALAAIGAGMIIFGVSRTRER
jgi:hypothetical protein